MKGLGLVLLIGAALVGCGSSGNKTEQKTQEVQTPDVVAQAEATLHSGRDFPVASLTLTPTITPTATITPTPTTTPTYTPTNDPDIAAMQKAAQGVSSNGEWVPYIKDFDGVEMVLVPAGCFMMGSDNGDSDERPVHEICFDEPFWVDRYEVTNAQFAAFNGQAGRESNWTDDNLPRESITWFEARDFCELREGRLPTEAEWEYAARGPDALVYPWGDEFDEDNVVYDGNSDDHTWAVGSKPDGVSWVGALDISGNVWEWTSSIYQSYSYKSDDGREDINNTNNSRVFRGGSFGGIPGDTRVADRNWLYPFIGSSNVGLRCVRSH